MSAPATHLDNRSHQHWGNPRNIPRGFELTHGVAVMRVTALAPDLIRFQVLPNSTDAAWPTGAISRTHWNPVATQVQEDGNDVRLFFPGGCFEIECSTGCWRLQNAAEQTLFETAGEGMHWEQEKVRCSLRLAPGEALFGLGETTGQFDRRGLVRDFWNIDVLGHAPAIHPGLKQLYVSIPYALCWKGGICSALFWDNAARQIWDMGQSHPDEWRLKADSGGIDFYLFTGSTPEQISMRYADLTGRIPLPPRWALGYQQSRYSYETSEEVLNIAREFRRRKLPCDVLYLDIHHMDGYRVFTFGSGFPKPANCLRALEKRGFKVVAIVDPGVKNDPEFGVLQRGVAADAFVKQADGVTDQLGEVWPGESKFPDFLNPEVRKWWGKEQRALLDVGVVGVWNDMNEPANFARPDKTLPPDCLHRTPDGLKPHEAVHNLYGMAMAQASFEGMLRWKHPRARRPFVVTRAGYAGVQRSAVVWTGDTSSNWDHLNDAVQMLVNLSLSGIAFCGADVGGFLENATGELFARWFQFAAFTPFFRSHTNIGTARQEPWSFGPEIEGICRQYLELRARWMPWWYSLIAEAHRSGSPLLRPMLWSDPSDEIAVRCGDQFLVGDGVLVAPILRQGARARSVYLPAGRWYDFWTGDAFEGRQFILREAPLQRIPLLIRAGTILPAGPVTQHTLESAPQTVDLHVWLGGDGSFTWQEDDGKEVHTTPANSWKRRIRLIRSEDGHLLEFAAPEGGFKSNVRAWRLLLHGMGSRPRVFMNGQDARLRLNAAQRAYEVHVPNDVRRLEIEIRV